MKTSRSKQIAFLAAAFCVGLFALGQIMHDESQAISLCSVSCRCVTCGTAQVPGKLCVDWQTYCRGYKYVRSCAEYCGRTGAPGHLPVDY